MKAQTSPRFARGLLTSGLLLLVTWTRANEPALPLAQTLITNARVFDGKSATLAEGRNVLVDGDPLANLKLIEDPGKNFLVIMKDGKIYKNLLK